MIEREKIVRPWLTLVLGAGILLAMAAAYQGNEDFLKTVDPYKPTGISIAYLESRLAGHPDQPAMLETLAWQYLTLGHWDSALMTAQRLEDLGGDRIRRGPCSFASGSWNSGLSNILCKALNGRIIWGRRAGC